MMEIIPQQMSTHNFDISRHEHVMSEVLMKTAQKENIQEIIKER